MPSPPQDKIPPSKNIHHDPESVTAVQVLALLNRLSLNAYQSKNRQMLIFQILNDTIQVISYQRATLWNIEGDRPNLLGVSGQAYFNRNAGLADKWKQLVADLKKKDVLQHLSEESFSSKQELWKQVSEGQNRCSVQWFPIFVKDKLRYGLWLERWSGKPWDGEELEVLAFLMKVYGASFEKFSTKTHIKLLTKRKTLIFSLITICALLFIRIPLRVVAPAEVVPKNPVLITAPLNGVIAEMKVTPGETVKKNEILFVYDDRATLDELKAAQKQVEIIESQLHRAETNALESGSQANPFEFNTEPESSDIAVLSLQLEKEKIRLNLAQSEAQKLYVKSPVDGVVILDNPEEWRGHPVKIGERVLMVSNPNDSKVRIWIPESDNIPLDEKQPIKVILNISPNVSYDTHLIYVSSYSEVSPHGIPSFTADSEWNTQPTDVKLGLEGTAILYGENVTLFYWIIRRPWTAIRHFLGL